MIPWLSPTLWLGVALAGALAFGGVQTMRLANLRTEVAEAAAKAMRQEAEDRAELTRLGNRASATAQARTDELRRALEQARGRLRDVPIPDCTVPADVGLLHRLAADGAPGPAAGKPDGAVSKP